MNLDTHRVQTSQLAKVFHLQKNISKRQNKNLPCDQLKQKLQQLVESSSAKTEKIAADFPSIELKKELPIAEKADDIKALLATNQTIIVAGETGCGKTTQLAKICFQAGFGARGLIGHTQPRRVAATSVAKRIADEVNSPIGELVGYAIRFSSKTSEQTRLKIMTDGILLTEIEADPLLSRYEVIIIDEAHERSLNIDFILGFLKQILVKRKELKLIITSATIDLQRFSKHFANAPIISVEGRTYPVEVRYRPLGDDQDNPFDDQSNDSEPLLNAIGAAVDECIHEASGDILIFADGEGQIKNIVKHLNGLKLKQTTILPLYARLSIGEQQKIFAASSQRKIIVSTNVAETSLTVPGILFVIDIGTARISRFSHRNKIQQLPVEKISRASAEQRKGRCGRVAPGICFRLYSEQDFLNREEFTCAEIKRTNLSSVALRLKAMKVNQVEGFPFIEPPQERAWKVAFNSLYELGAIDKKQAITTIGSLMAKLPVDPQLARILVEPNLKAVNEMLIICSLMSVREVRERPHDKQQKADQLHSVYHQKNSDILTAINLWQLLETTRKATSSNGFKQWCSKNLINFLGWLEWRKVYFQLKESVEALGIQVNTSACHDDEIHQGLIPGFITHIFCKTQENYYQGVRGLKVWLHPSSLSFKNKQPWLLSAEMIETEKLYARMNCPIKPEWLEQSARHLLKDSYADIHWRKKSGQVVAYLSQNFLGLPIVNNRLVNYSSNDPEKCREIFLKDGLAMDQLGEDFPFLSGNRKKLMQLKEQEQRQRQNNICISGDALADLYAKNLPKYICSTISLKRWLKKDFKQRNQLLSFSLEQLTDNQQSGSEDYPSQLKVKGFNLNLSYCFEPGSEADGVSVEIPEQMVAQFNDRDFDWLVPGYLEEKVLATIKTLPKNIRRDLIPLSETAAECSATIRQTEQSNTRFIDELARVLQRQSGKHIEAEDFDMQSVPPHLTMKYKLVGKKSTVKLASLTSLQRQKIHQDISTQTQNSVARIYQWQANEFLLEKQVDSEKQSSRIFQGLKDKGQYVIVAQFPSLNSAIESHAQGVARLLMLQNASLLNQFFNSWPERKQLEMLSIRFSGFRGVFDSLVMKWGVSIVQEIRYGRAFSDASFQQANQTFTKKFREVLSNQLQCILPLIKQREKVFSTIAELKSIAYADSVKDMRAQLSELWSFERLLASGNRLFDDYSRYHEGLLKRIGRLKSNYPKEQDAMETWLEWLDWWKELPKSSYQHDIESRLRLLYWDLQEFKISLFSPGVKVKGAVSAHKLQQTFERLDSDLTQ